MTRIGLIVTNLLAITVLCKFWPAVFFLVATMFATTIYLHRSLTHRALELHPVVKNVMHLVLCLFTAGIVPREWVAVHRKHHHFSDEEGDPHSPYIRGLWAVFWENTILYRTAAADGAMVRQYTPDYKADLIDRLLPERYMQFVGPAAGIALFSPIFGVWAPVAWFSQDIVYNRLNASINSICHMIGYRNYDNLATNHEVIALLTAGEGLHNNHHKHPSSAKFAHVNGEIDLGWWFIRLLAALRLAKVKAEPIAAIGRQASQSRS